MGREEREGERRRRVGGQVEFGRWRVDQTLTRTPCYRKDDRAMRPIYGRPEKFRESLATPTATFPETVNDYCCDRLYESAPDSQCWGQPQQRP